MSLIDALAAASWVVAAMLFAAAAIGTMAAIVIPPIFAAISIHMEGLVWPWLARLAAWWLASLAALVLLIWIDGNVDQWWPR